MKFRPKCSLNSSGHRDTSIGSITTIISIDTLYTVSGWKKFPISRSAHVWVGSNGTGTYSSADDDETEKEDDRADPFINIRCWTKERPIDPV